MNELGRDVLRAAALRGVPQIRGTYENGDGRCAMGVLMDASGEDYLTWFRYGLGATPRPCPHGCGRSASEGGLIIHMNDDHGDDFLTIANKL